MENKEKDERIFLYQQSGLELIEKLKNEGYLNSNEIYTAHISLVYFIGFLQHLTKK